VVRDVLASYINAGDLFVAMSDRTNAANPLFEAMICAKPCVVLDTGATSEVIRHAHNGWLIPEAHPERLGATLIEVLSDWPRALEVGERALEWARAHIPTYEERQRMEVALVEEAAREGMG
jgi:glycosyltransferase involved in cell wall biosynthesis